MNIEMEIVPDSYEEEGEFSCCFGKITIFQNNCLEPFWETFMVALDYWSINDYRQQWREGLERIKTHDISCLVASVYNPRNGARVVWWPLYKEGNQIFIQNELIAGDEYVKWIGHKIFSPETCYNFVTPRVTETPEGYRVSEWAITVPEREVSTH
jgi:hypothetical protein